MYYGNKQNSPEGKNLIYPHNSKKELFDDHIVMYIIIQVYE